MKSLKGFTMQATHKIKNRKVAITLRNVGLLFCFLWWFGMLAWAMIVKGDNKRK